jgi:hypothetical protein
MTWVVFFLPVSTSLSASLDSRPQREQTIERGGLCAPIPGLRPSHRSVPLYGIAKCDCSSAGAHSFRLTGAASGANSEGDRYRDEHGCGFQRQSGGGLLAPSLQADLTVDDALVRVLVGAGLRPQHLNDHTIVIAAVTLETSALTKPPPQAFVPTDTTEASPRVAKVAETLMLAQANEPITGAPGNSSGAGKSSDEDQLQEVVVTGTHIRGVAPSSPVVTITREDIDESGYSSIGDVMRSLPQNYSGGNSPQLTVASAPGIDNGATFSGGSSPNLRGLGSGSTLTLVNGPISGETPVSVLQAGRRPKNPLTKPSTARRSRYWDEC